MQNISVWLRTGSNSLDNIRFRSHTEKVVKLWGAGTRGSGPKWYQGLNYGNADIFFKGMSCYVV